MRDVIFAAIMGFLIPVSFLRPWLGILVFSWLAYMNPHQHCFGFARMSVPWSEMVAIATLLGWTLARDRKPFIWSRETLLILLLWIWFTITTIFSWYPEDAWLDLQSTSKILLMTLMAIPLIQERNRLRWLLVVIAVSLGFYGFKAGFFVITTGGNYMVSGAPGRTFVSSNNALALALNMCLPLFWYLRKEETRPWVRHLLLATFCLSAIAVPFTYSRGGVLGLACVLTILSLRSKRRYLTLPALCVGALLLFAVAPEKWVDRMQTLEDYDKDQSAMSRLQAWKMGIRIANDSPLFGAGFNAFNRAETYAIYAPQLGRRTTDAHSIYFNLLGEHGYVGLGLFIILVFCTLGTVASTYRTARRYEELAWAADYAYMLGASIMAYLVTGAFLSVAYFDLAWQLFTLTVVLNRLMLRELSSLAPAHVRVRSVPQSAARLLPGVALPSPTRFTAGGPTAIAPRESRT